MIEKIKFTNEIKRRKRKIECVMDEVHPKKTLKMSEMNEYHLESQSQKLKIENRKSKLKAPTTIALGLPWTPTTRPELAQSSPRTRSRLRSGLAQLAVPAQLEVESFRRRLELAQSSPRARRARPGLAQGSLRCCFEVAWNSPGARPGLA